MPLSYYFAAFLKFLNVQWEIVFSRLIRRRSQFLQFVLILQTRLRNREDAKLKTKTTIHAQRTSADNTRSLTILHKQQQQWPCKAKVLIVREHNPVYNRKYFNQSSFLRLRLILVDNHTPLKLDVKAPWLQVWSQSYKIVARFSFDLQNFCNKHL